MTDAQAALPPQDLVSAKHLDKQHVWEREFMLDHVQSVKLETAANYLSVTEGEKRAWEEQMRAKRDTVLGESYQFRLLKYSVHGNSKLFNWLTDVRNDPSLLDICK